jgi:alpha-glucosidase
VKSFAQLGFKGAWLDMNDPATGDSLNDLMLFDRGTKNHSSFHNQYGMGMARASRDGFLKANPEERPFLLSRSGFTGTSKYAAIWTGDNVSNYHYLKGSIATTLNLALSGIPFNGPDVAGFGKDTNPQLMIDWMKAGFLFPILRNHSCKGTADQEPWAFDHNTTDIYRHYVQMRYKLRPYLYNLFAEQELCGEAILRPMFYNFENEIANDLSRIDDQFMVGSAILQAPFVEEGQQRRSLILPSTRWYDTQNGIWIEGGRSIEVEKEDFKTPLYLRDGSLLPMSRNTGDDNTFSSSQIDLHLVMSNTNGNCAKYQYHFDDGNSFQYQKGKRSTMAFTAEVRNGCLYIETELKENGYGDLDFSLVCYDHFDKVVLNGVQRECSSSDFQWVTGQKTLSAC